MSNSLVDHDRTFENIACICFGGLTVAFLAANAYDRIVGPDVTVLEKTASHSLVVEDRLVTKDRYVIYEDTAMGRTVITSTYTDNASEGNAIRKKFKLEYR